MQKPKEIDLLKKSQMLQARIEDLERFILMLSKDVKEHPEGYNGPCLCGLCKSYG